MANTIIGLNDTPSSYSLSANKFLRVNSDANAVQFWDIQQVMDLTKQALHLM